MLSVSTPHRTPNRRPTTSALESMAIAPLGVFFFLLGLFFVQELMARPRD